MALSLTTPMPLQEAVKQLSAKTPVGTYLRTAQWDDVPLALRWRAFFSATVESARVLQTMKNGLDAAIQLQRENVTSGRGVDRGVFVSEMKKVLQQMGYRPDPDHTGGLQDVSSERRLGLIFDMNVAQAQGFAQYKADLDPDVLDAYPAQELLRIEARRVPRGTVVQTKRGARTMGQSWPDRWREAGGKLIDGRMIALKTDPIWAKISRFRTPFPPFDFQSGMGLEDISRSEAEDLGLLQPGEEISAEAISGADFNAHLEASIAGFDPALRAQLQKRFGSLAEIDGDVIRWRGEGGTAVGNSRGYVRDRLGRFASDQGGGFGSSDAAVAANVERGRKAMSLCIETKQDQLDAMHCPGVGSVDFIWGNSGSGIRHIIEKRDREGRDRASLRGQSGKDVALQMPEVIARGKLSPPYIVNKDVRRSVTFGNFKAVLSLRQNNQKRAWLVTGFELVK